MAAERWKPVPLLEFIHASDHGRIRAVKREGIDGRRVRKRICPFTKTQGYDRVVFYLEGKRRTFYVHRLVALAWVPGYFPEATVEHIDGNRVNNLPRNLMWVTRRENTLLQAKAGRISKGERHCWSKISDADAERIPIMRAQGMTLPAIAREFGVSPGSIWQRLGNKTGKVRGL